QQGRGRRIRVPEGHVVEGAAVGFAQRYQAAEVVDAELIQRDGTGDGIDAEVRGPQGRDGGDLLDVAPGADRQEPRAGRDVAERYLAGAEQRGRVAARDRQPDGEAVEAVAGVGQVDTPPRGGETDGFLLGRRHAGAEGPALADVARGRDLRGP